MGLLLAPYNNGMRLGQGFNSYTQAICIDDAVVVDPDRAENVVTNDGTTMRTLVEQLHKPSAWTRQKEVLISPESAAAADEPEPEPEKPERNGNPELEASPVEVTGEDGVAADEEAADGKELTTEEQLAEDKKLARAKARKEEREREAWMNERKKEAVAAANMYKNALTIEEMKKLHKVSFEKRPDGLQVGRGEFEYDPTEAAGPSQTVTYSSRFVDKLSDITDDMNISGSLSIKYGAIGGSGRGAFIDSDKFKESDMNFYISVKVVNQTINFKDALKYQPLASVDENNFKDIYGDTFISGFAEGGEFNALVSMKVLNKAKKTDIQAEAKVALTIGAGSIEAQAAVDIAKQNINTNTETTIQVSWSGGGHIKPLDEPWTVDSLTRAAARFPDLVASAPQRTYAILTKYESLRSFMALKPPLLSPINYENALLYTNALMDTFMSYKSIYTTVSADIFAVQSGTKYFKTSAGQKNGETEDAAKRPKLSFPSTIAGLDQARRAIRQQMNVIVKEVDLITKDPSIATDEHHAEPFIGAAEFQQCIPAVDIVRPPSKETPLTGVDLSPKTGEEAPPPQDDLSALFIGQGDLSPAEKEKVFKIQQDRANISEHLRLTAPVGSVNDQIGNLFCNLDFMQPDFVISSIAVEMHEGVIGALTVSYTNGLVLARGAVQSQYNQVVLDQLGSVERIIAGSIETGVAKGGNAEAEVTSLYLYTNRGRSLVATADSTTPVSDKEAVRDGRTYTNLTTTSWDMPLANGYVKGFWGRSDEMFRNGTIWRLGLIWGDLAPPSSQVTSQSQDDRKRVIHWGKISALDDVAAFKAKNDKTDIQFVEPRKFDTPLLAPPRMLWGLCLYDVIAPTRIGLYMRADNVTEQGFTVTGAAYGGCNPYNMAMNWLTLPNNNVHMECGEVHTYDAGRQNDKSVVNIRIYFPSRFKAPPIVRCWFTEINIPNGWRSLKTWVTDISEQGCTLHIDTWADRRWDGARVMWFAYDAGADAKMIRSGTYTTPRGPAVHRDDPWYNGRFSRQPGAFIALSEIDMNCTRNQRAHASVDQATPERLQTTLGSWADTDCDHLVATWLAIQG